MSTIADEVRKKSLHMARENLLTVLFTLLYSDPRFKEVNVLIEKIEEMLSTS